MSGFNVVFKGEVLSDFEVDGVKANLAKLLKIDVLRVSQMFNGVQYNIKTNINKEEAIKLQEKLEKIGMLCELMENHEGGGSNKSDAIEESQINLNGTKVISNNIQSHEPYSMINYTMMLVVRLLFIFFPVNYLFSGSVFIPFGLTIVLFGSIIGVVLDVLFPSSIIGGRFVAKAFNTGTLCWFKGINLSVKIDTTGKGVAIKDEKE